MRRRSGVGDLKEKSAMKKCIVVITLILLGIALHADSVWTGNAAVGGVSEFPGPSDVYRAASNSFPAGTVLEVTNPKGGKSTFVTVIGRLESPGVFILIESNAAEDIDLPSDHVLPVRVSPVESMEEAEDPVVHSEAVTDDADYNPAAGLEEGPLEPRTAVVAAAEEPEPEDAIEDEEAVVEEAETIEEVAEEEMPEYRESEAEPETIITYVVEDEAAEAEEDDDIAVTESGGELVFESGEEEPPVVPVEEEEKGEDGEKDGGKVYFLTPSDLRPPPAVEEEDETIVEETGTDEDMPDEESLEERRPFDIQLVSAVPGDGSSYIQIGAYESRAILEESARRAKSDGIPYPLSVASGERGGRTIYKLLIGPLRPAERGVVLRTLKSSAYPDAFPFEP